jgi:glycine C-acetyltransferase
LMVFVYMGKRFFTTSIMILKVWKDLQRATKMATETGGGILFYRRCFGMRGQQGELTEIYCLKKL